VLWVVRDEVSYLGLPLLLRDVDAVGSATVVRIGEAGAELGGARRADVVVVPLEHHDALQGPLRARRAQGTRVLVQLPGEERSSILRAVSRSVDGYLLAEDLTGERLQAFFGRMALGDVVLPEPIIKELMSWLGPAAAGPRSPARLTRRERAVLALLVQGQSNQQIASSLGISIHGAKRHVSNLLVKFNCSNRTELALAAVDLGVAAAAGPGGRAAGAA
jgi:DNA-binding NarL/FixJ family response regulator